MAEEMDLTTFPSSPKRDVASVVGQAVAGLLPYGGGVVGVLLSALMPEFSRDRIAWLEYVGAAVLQHGGRLANHDARLDVHDTTLADHEARLSELHAAELARRPEFRAAFLQAADIAMRDPLRKKWVLLRNAVQNVAAGKEPDYNRRTIFLAYIGDLTELHLVFLDCIADPFSWAKQRNYPVYVGPQEVDARSIFEGKCRDELQPPGLLNVLLQDLYARGLAANDVNPDAFLSHPPEMFRPHITDLGRLFLAFITAPSTDSDEH